MKDILIYPAGSTEACALAGVFLQKAGFSVTDHPAPEITHLLLDVPAFRSDGLLRSGEVPEKLLSMVPRKVIVAGGNLDHPVLRNHTKLDFLQDAEYLAQNAAITAHCAIKIAMTHLKTTLRDTPTLILGWGRIGKCLARLLTGLDCPVTVAARKEKDRAMLHALGYDAVDFTNLDKKAFRLLFNTVPEPVCPAGSDSCLKIELASQPGLTSSDVIQAKGLPGLHAPESSGRLIADTFFRIWKENDQ